MVYIDLHGLSTLTSRINSTATHHTTFTASNFCIMSTSNAILAVQFDRATVGLQASLMRDQIIGKSFAPPQTIYANLR